MKKKILVVVAIVCMLATTAFALLYEVKILTNEEIKKLNDQKIVDVYIDAMIERRAGEAFNGKAGFTPKEYQGFKDLLGFIVRLRQEMAVRNLEVPPIEEWLK